MSERKKILLVDDDADIIEQYKLILEGKYDLEWAYSGEECKNKVALKKPDLIIMDVMMNHLSDGLEMAKILKEDEKTKDIAIIMATGVNEVYNYRDQVEDAYFPKDKWLDKPVKAEILLAEVEKLIGK